MLNNGIALYNGINMISRLLDYVIKQLITCCYCYTHHVPVHHLRLRQLKIIRNALKTS